MVPILKKGSEAAKEWVRKRFNDAHDVTEIPSEIPPEIEEEVNEAVQNYFESSQYPVYMDGVVFFFQDVLNNDVKQELREIIRQFDWEDGECSGEKYRVYQFIRQYMGAEREEEANDFGFEENFLYLNFYGARKNTERLFNEAKLREVADALNQLLSDNEIESFRTF